MLEPGPQVSVRAVKPILGGLRARGVDVAAALAAARVPPEALADLEGRVPHEAAVRLWRFAVTTTGDEDFGLAIVRALPDGALGVPEYAFRKSATIREGLERLTRYTRLNHDVARIEAWSEGDQVCFSHQLPAGRPLPRAAVDFIVAGALRLIRGASGREVIPLEICVDYPEPEDPSELEAFYGRRPRFATGQRRMTFSAADADAPMAESEPGLCAVLDRHARDLLDQLPTTTTFADRVRTLIARELRGGNPNAEHIADQMRCNVRTLQRHLKEEGTSHKAILTELRDTLARSYLSDPAMTVSEVAFLLGFSEPSAFHRAFKRRVGQTPAEFRRLVLA